MFTFLFLFVINKLSIFNFLQVEPYLDKKLQAARHTLDSFFETIDLELEVYPENYEVDTYYDEDFDMLEAGGVPATAAVGGRPVGNQPTHSQSRAARRKRTPKKKPRQLVLKNRKVVKVKAIDELINHLIEERNLDHGVSVKLGIDVSSLIEFT